MWCFLESIRVRTDTIPFKDVFEWDIKYGFKNLGQHERSSNDKFFGRAYTNGHGDSLYAGSAPKRNNKTNETVTFFFNIVEHYVKLYYYCMKHIKAHKLKL